ncbi:hypothetical protein [Vibrio mexicanus]|uniref:hypothetical protein n=1 Tax=Vibrio mexicanus TaxID=1004326 RepID=UPI00063CF7CB|nr:hypothetical protein [Vibrio mexicanus]
MSKQAPIYGFNTNQRLFVGYTLAILVDLVVLNLFNEYWTFVSFSSFSVSLAAAVLMQVLLKASIKAEHKIAAYFMAKEGVWPKVMRGVSSYIILVGSKFLILEVLNIVFGNNIQFTGPWNGVIAFIAVVFAILLAEKIVAKIYFSLNDSELHTEQVA